MYEHPAGMRSEGGYSAGGGAAPQLPEKVMMALVSTPAAFAVPSSINKGFNPPFVLRVGVVSSAPTQIKATVAAYVLQKDQVRRPFHLPSAFAAPDPACPVLAFREVGCTF